MCKQTIAHVNTARRLFHRAVCTSVARDVVRCQTFVDTKVVARAASANEEKIPELSAETLHLMNRNDMLMPLFMVLSSMSNIQQLIHLQNQALDG